MLVKTRPSPERCPCRSVAQLEAQTAFEAPHQGVFFVFSTPDQHPHALTVWMGVAGGGWLVSVLNEDAVASEQLCGARVGRGSWGTDRL